MKKAKKFRATKESWDDANFSLSPHQEARQEYWTAVNMLRELATTYDRDELMAEVDRDV